MSPHIDRDYTKILLRTSDNIIYPEKIHLNEDDILRMIREFPCIIPFTSSNKCIIMQDIQLNRKYDAIVFELSNDSVNIYILYLYYDYINLLFEDGNDIVDIYWSIEPEHIDEDVYWFYSSFTRSRKRKTTEIRKIIKKAFNLKRLRIGNVLVVFVVDDLTRPVRQFVDIANDDLEAYVAAMSIEKYCWSSDLCLYVSRGYTWG